MYPHSAPLDAASTSRRTTGPSSSERTAKAYLVPPIAANHRDPVVRELVRRLVRLYDCRASLRTSLADVRGDLILPPFPELLQRPPKRSKKGEPPPPSEPDFDRRRSDGMESIIRTALALAACTDWVTMEALDPRGGYLGVARLAELADLPLTIVPPTEDGDRERKRHDRADRALRALRTAQIVAFTKQHREKLEDGRFTSTGPALRKLAVGLFRKFGGHLLRVFEKRRKKLKNRREREAPTTGDLRVAATMRDLGRDFTAALQPGRAAAIASGRPGSVPPELLDQVHEEHPEWTMGELFQEARRRLERGPPAEAPPPDDETN